MCLNVPLFPSGVGDIWQLLFKDHICNNGKCSLPYFPPSNILFPLVCLPTNRTSVVNVDTKSPLCEALARIFRTVARQARPPLPHTGGEGGRFATTLRLFTRHLVSLSAPLWRLPPRPAGPAAPRPAGSPAAGRPALPRDPSTYPPVRRAGIGRHVCQCRLGHQ